MISIVDLVAWGEIERGLAHARERAFEARVMWEWYEQRRREIAERIAGRPGAE